jgi:hypothetical protein
MDWATLEGLGAGLQGVGNKVMTDASNDKKAALQEKLQQEREAREEQRAIAKEQRTALREDSTPDLRATDYVQKDGAWMERSRSATGKVLEEKLAPQSKIDELNMDRKKDEVSIESLLAKTALDNKKAASYDADHALDQDAKRSLIDYRKDQGLAATMRAEAATAPSVAEANKAPTDLANTLVKAYPDVVKEYTTGDSPKMTATQMQELAERVIRSAAAQRKDARAMFLEELKRYGSKEIKIYEGT